MNKISSSGGRFCIYENWVLNMLLVVAATEIEMEPFRRMCRLSPRHLLSHVAGVGPVETAVSLTRLCEQKAHALKAVVNFGIAGAYLHVNPHERAEMLDVCLAEKEIFGDFGICFDDRIEAFNSSYFSGTEKFVLDEQLRSRALQLLNRHGMPVKTGTFVTVNSASGSADRGRIMQKRSQGFCENMEGAAAARVCRDYALPLLEVRCISNLVEDRPGTPWRITEASRRAAEAASIIADNYEDLL